MYPILFDFSIIRIYSYGFFIALTILFSYLLLRYLAKKENLYSSHIDILFIILVISGIFGSRLAYLIEHRHTLEEFFSFWQGLSSTGGVFFALIAGVSAIKLLRLKKRIYDILGIIWVFSIGIGKSACLSAGCCYGKPTKLPIGIEFFHPSSLAPIGVNLLPTQFIELLGGLIIALVLYKIYKRKNTGVTFSFSFILYGIFRFFIEFLRDVTPVIGVINLTWVQIVCISYVLAGFLMLKYRNKIFV